MESARKQYRTVGLTLFIISIALLVMRIISYYVQVALLQYDSPWIDLLTDAIFTVPLQIGILFAFPFLMYKFGLKKSAREVLKFSNYRRCNPWIYVLAVAVGFLMLFVSYALSIIWNVILTIFGYASSGGGALPETFNVGYFLLTVLLTAVLPAICEEFTNRGGLLTVMRGSFTEFQTILIIGLAFGLFHQNIGQIFYTAVFGALLAFITLETGSIFPAIIIHFMNNFISVCIDNATTYNWAIGGNFYNFIYETPFEVLTSIIALIFLAVFGLVFAMVAISRKQRSKAIPDSVAVSGFKIGIEDNIFYAGAIVVTILSTLLTFAFGL